MTIIADLQRSLQTFRCAALGDSNDAEHEAASTLADNVEALLQALGEEAYTADEADDWYDRDHLSP